MAARYKTVCVFIIALLLVACGSSPQSTSTSTVLAAKVVESQADACTGLTPGAKYRAICGDSTIVDGADDAVCAQHGGVSTWMVCPQAAAVTPAPVEQITATALPAPTNAPAIADTDVITKGYWPLIALLFVSNGLDEIATKQQTGELSAVQQFGSLIAVGLILSSTTEMLNQPPPSDAFQPAWEKGKAIAPILKDVLGKWANKEIQASDVHAALAPAQEQITQMEQLVEQVLVSQYGIDANMLHARRDEAMSKMRESLSLIGTTPTP